MSRRKHQGLCAECSHKRVFHLWGQGKCSATTACKCSKYVPYRAGNDTNQQRIDTGFTDAELATPLKKIYDRVVAIAKKYPEVKGDYNLLVTRYQWAFHGRAWGINFEELLKLESPESITRAFRKAVERGAIEPTLKMRARRAQRERAIRNSIGKLGGS